MSHVVNLPGLEISGVSWVVYPIIPTVSFPIFTIFDLLTNVWNSGSRDPSMLELTTEKFTFRKNGIKPTTSRSNSWLHKACKAFSNGAVHLGICKDYSRTKRIIKLCISSCKSRISDTQNANRSRQQQHLQLYNCTRHSL